MVTILVLLACVMGSLRSARTGESPERVDRIEINTYLSCYDVDDKPVYHQQIVIWRWHPEFAEYHVADWFTIDDGSVELPVRLPGGQWTFRYKGFSDRQWHKIITDDCFESKTEYDVERADRLILPELMRLRLRGMIFTGQPASMVVEGVSMVEAPE